MCHQEEIIDSFRSTSFFEKIKENPELSKLVMIKRYMRSEPGKVMNDPGMIRPPRVLYLTMKYMRDCILDLD
jgi:hypothetical protein